MTPRKVHTRLRSSQGVSSLRSSENPKPRGAVAQLGERLNGIQEVVGSIPSGSTIFIKGLAIIREAFFILGDDVAFVWVGRIVTAQKCRRMRQIKK